MAETFFDSARDVVRNGFCGALSVADGFGDWLSDGGTSGSIFSLQSDIARNQVNGLQGLFCDRAPGPPPQVTPPASFEGGQCPVEYSGTIFASTEVNGNLASANTAFQSNSFFQGPIEDVRISADRRSLEIVEAGGNVANFITLGNNRVRFREINDVDLLKRDGSPDDCGNRGDTSDFPPPPGTETPIEDDIVYGPPGNEITIPVGLLFAPVFVTVNGELSIPFSIENPEFSLIGNLSLTDGDINFNFGGGRPDTEGCCLPPTVDDDGPGDEDDENDGETRTVIIGVLVNGTVDDSLINATQIGQPNGPDFYQPRIGNVIFQMRVSGQLFWTEPIAVKHPNQYIECPADFGAIRVLGNASPGVSLQLSPIRRKIPVTELP